MFVRATEADRPMIEAFLSARMATAMFPLANLKKHGMAGGHDRAMQFWVVRDGGVLTDVLAMTDGGMVMPNCPTEVELAAQALAGQSIVGLLGPAEQCRVVHKGLGLRGVERILDRDEPQFSLTLDRLTLPDGIGELRPLTATPRAVLEEWILTYDMEALGSSLSAAKERAPETLERYIQNDSHRVLLDGDRCLAMTGFNAQVGSCVQIGGVFTPDDLRGNGHARRAVALHLAEAKAQGVTDATLFSANEAASRAYRSIGFEQFGEWTICLLKDPMRV